MKKLILQQYDFDETTQQHDSTLDYEQNASKEEFPNNAKLKPFQHCIEELEIKPEPQNENAIKEEIAEEGLTEIKEEFSNDPFAPLEMLNNCKIISITPYKCSVCQITFVSHEEVLEHACVQSNEKKVEIEEEKPLNFHNQEEIHEKNHIDSVQESIKWFSCSICDKKFTKKCYMNRHTNSVHEKKKPHKCSMCDKSFYTVC